MTQPFLTASRIDLFRECRVFPSLSWTADDSTAAQAGTDAHAQALRPGGLEPPFLAWFGDEPRYEVAMGWNGQRAVILGENTNRAYDLPDSEINPMWETTLRYFGQVLLKMDTLGLSESEKLALQTLEWEIEAGMRPIAPTPLWLAGTADTLSVRNRVLSVADLKTGRGQVSGGLLPPAKSGQLRLLAYMLWQVMLDRTKDPTWTPERIRVAWFLHAEGGEPRVEDTEIDPADLQRWSLSLMANARIARDNPPPARPGEHCRYCPAFDACPAQGGAIRRLSELPMVNDAEVVTAHTAIQHAEKQIDRAKLAVRNYLSRRQDQIRAGVAQEVEVSAGKILNLTSNTRRGIDGPAALASGLIPPEAAEVSVTLDSIRSWLAKSPQYLSSLRHLANGENDRMATADDVMATLEKIGVVTQSRTSAFPQIVRKK